MPHRIARIGGRLGALAAVGLLCFGCPDSGTALSPIDALDLGGVVDAMIPGDGDSSKRSCDPFAPAAVAAELLIGPTGLEARLLKAIEASQLSIDLMMYQLTRPSLVKALSTAHTRGVSVRVLIDARQSVNAATVTALKGAGIDIRNAPASFSHYHPKVLIVDGASAVLLSANFNDYSMTSERNYGLLLTSEQEVEDLEMVFNADFSGQTLAGLDCSRLIVSPSNARQRLNALIAGAEKTLDLAVMYLSDPELKKTVIARHHAGVALRILLANPSWIDSNSELATELEKEGISVRYLSYPELHAKLIIADDHVFVGSQNLSWTSIEQNRELGLLDGTKAVVDQVRSQFNTDWNAGQSFIDK